MICVRIIGGMRATRAIIDLDALSENLRQIRVHIGPAPRVCLAVKADAYGHGTVPVSRAALAAGVEFLAVATVDEGRELRDSGICAPILLYTLPIPEELDAIVTHRITPVVGDLELVSALDHAARGKQPLLVHLKIDTGMGRLGCTPLEAPEIAAAIAQAPNLQLAGVSTHFPVSDERDEAFTNAQIARFDAAIESIRSAGINPGIVHAANSGAVLAHKASWNEMVRPGLLAYGYYPSREQKRVIPVRPVMELRSKVVLIKRVPAGTRISYGLTWKATRDTDIGTVPIGYGDGYSRLLSNRAEVLIGEHRYPIAGRVCMDQIMVDLGTSGAVKRYDDVVLFGPQAGAPTAEELAELCGTIPYEVTCAVSKRVPRVYRGSET